MPALRCSLLTITLFAFNANSILHLLSADRYLQRRSTVPLQKHNCNIDTLEHYLIVTFP